MVVLSLGGFVLLAVLWIAATVISRKLGAILLALYLVLLFLVASGLLSGVSLA